jgi:hypothetical protein
MYTQYTHKEKVVMRINIWIPDDLIEGVKESAYKKRKSVSQYLVDLHRAKIDIPAKMTSEPTKEVKKSILTTEQIEMKEKLRPLYTNEYRGKNPMETCKTCGKAIKFCSH